MKKSIKLVSVIFMIAMLIIMPLSTTFAFTPSNFAGNTAINGINDIAEKGNKVIGAMQVVGTIISVAILIVIGIKYMMGSAEEKASYKKTMVPYLVGAALLFAASNLAQTIYNAVVNF